MIVGAIKPKSLVFTLELQTHTTSHIHTSKWNQSLLSKPRSCWREFKHLMYKCIMYKHRWGRLTAVNVSEQL